MMFGLPKGNPLRESVTTLTRDHHHTVGELTGTEPGLLVLLERAIRADTSGGSGGAGRNKNSAPLDVIALTLWEEVSEVVARNWPGRGALMYKDQHLIDRLTWWTRTVAGTPSEPFLLEYTEYWERRIRELLDPPQKIELRGTPCPSCKQSWVRTLEAEAVTLRPALMVYMSDDPVRVECLHCYAVWLGWKALEAMNV